MAYFKWLYTVTVNTMNVHRKLMAYWFVSLLSVKQYSRHLVCTVLIRSMFICVLGVYHLY